MVNGHSNSILGGTGANERDLYSAYRGDLDADGGRHGMGMQMGVPNTPWVCGFYGDQCSGIYPLDQSGVCESDCSNLRNSG